MRTLHSGFRFEMSCNGVRRGNSVQNTLHSLATAITMLIARIFLVIMNFPLRKEVSRK